MQSEHFASIFVSLFTGRDSADPQDHEGSAGGRIPTPHQEGFELQALGQAAAEAETVILSRLSCELCGHPLSISN
jgi:hypothetical protein